MMGHFVFILFCIALILSLKHLKVSIQHIDLEATYFSGDGVSKAVRKTLANLFTNTAAVCTATLMIENRTGFEIICFLLSNGKETKEMIF